MPDERRQTPRTNDDARTECYEAVRVCLREALLGFYRNNPDLMAIINERTAQSTVDSTQGALRSVLSVLDRYEIIRKR